MDTGVYRRHSRRIWFWGILIFIILFLLCLWFHTDSIARDIKNRVAAALEAKEADLALGLYVDGRDVILSGEIDERVNRAELVEAAGSVRGVRTVVDKLVVVKRQSSHLSLTAAGDTVTLMGVLPSQEAVDKAVNAATAAYGVKKVLNELTVDNKAREPTWLDGLAKVVPELSLADPAGLEAGEDKIVLSGDVDSAPKRAAIGARAEAVFAGIARVDNRVQVVAPKTSSRLVYRIVGGTITLRGELPNQEAVDSAIESARSVVDSDLIINELTVSDNVPSPDWLKGVLQIIPEMGEVDPGGIEITDQGLTLSGIVDAADKRAVVGSRAKALVGELPLNNRIVVLAPHEAKAQRALIKLDRPEIQFESGSVRLTALSSEVLDPVVSVLQQYPDVRVEVAGHTDSSGEHAYNLDLSQQRAHTIVQYLVSKGIDANRLEPRGYGENRPIAENGTEAGRAKNRRIEFKVFE